MSQHKLSSIFVPGKSIWLIVLLKLLNISYLNKGHQADFVEWTIAACGKSPAENAATDEEITLLPS